MIKHFHCLTALKPSGTNSFRYASAQLLGEFGANLQNSDKESLSGFEAWEGHSFVQCDQAGAEALVVAHLARPGNYRTLFNVGIKPHTFVAMHIFIEAHKHDWPLAGKTPEHWKSLPPEALAKEPGWKALDKAIKNSGKPYKIGKMICHASSYRMRERTFQLQTLKQSQGTLVLSFDECKHFLSFFALLFPEIIDWQNEIELTVIRNRTLRNLFGYPRRFERPITDSYIRECISWIPQSTVGCITHLAANRFNRLRNPAVRPAINNKHDSFLTMPPDQYIAETGKLMQECLAARLVGRDGVEFVMKSDFQVGKNWGGHDPAENPLGMKVLEG